MYSKRKSTWHSLLGCKALFESSCWACSHSSVKTFADWVWYSSWIGELWCNLICYPSMCRNGGWGGGSSFALYAPFSHRVRGPMVGPQQAMPNLPGGHWDPTPGQPPRHENCQQGVYAVSIGINAAARRTASTTATGYIHFFKTRSNF